MKFRNAIIAMGMSIAAVTSVASAGFSANYVGYGNFETHAVGYSSSLAWDSSVAITSFNLKLAEHKWDVGGSTVYTWCAQLYQGVTSGTTYVFNPVSLENAPQTPPAPGPMGIVKANVLRDAMSRWLESDSRVVASAGTGSAASAAFCALGWEIIHENFGSVDEATLVSRLSLTNGAFRAALTGESAKIYSSMVASLGQGGWRSIAAEGWDSPTAQDQFRVVPAPGAFALLGIAGGLAARRRR